MAHHHRQHSSDDSSDADDLHMFQSLLGILPEHEQKLEYSLEIKSQSSFEDAEPSHTHASIIETIKQQLGALRVLKSVVEGFHGSLFDVIEFFHTEKHKQYTDKRSDRIINDLDYLQLISHYFKYALGALGWLAIGQDKNRIGMILRLEPGAVPLTDEQTVLQMTGMNKDDYIDGYFPLNPIKTDFVPGWFIGIDREQKAVVAGFRSSISAKDWITDFHATNVPFETPRVPDGMAHDGMLAATRKLYATLGPKILETLEKNPGYSFVTTGHSLGAGVASLFAIVFHADHGEQYVTKSYAYACPATVSPAISVAYRDVVTTIALDVDVVPRLSMGSIEQLRDESNAHAAAHAHRSILERLGELLHLTHHKEAPASTTEPKFVYEDEFGQKHAFNQARLAVPGTLVRFVHPASWKEGKKDKWQLENETWDYVADVVVHQNMFKRHLPIEYQHAIDYVVEQAKKSQPTTSSITANASTSTSSSSAEVTSCSSTSTTE